MSTVIVPNFQMDDEDILDKMTVIYGPSDSGKTFIVRDMLRVLCKHAPVLTVVSPTDKAKQQYSTFLDKAFIHYDIIDSDGCNILEKIYDIQEVKTGFYTKANNIDILKSLYNRKPNTAVSGKLATIIEKRDNLISNTHANNVDTLATIKSKTDDMMIYIYKTHIIENINFYKNLTDIPDNERYVVEYITLNPRLILVLDDCAAELKPHFKSTIFRKMFYQGRHNSITTIICCQDDTDLPANLRKNVMMNIFTRKETAISNFERKVNGYGASLQKYVKTVIPHIYVGHQKMILYKSTIYKYTAQPCANPVQPDDTLVELCNRLKVSDGDIDTSNPFYIKYKI